MSDTNAKPQQSFQDSLAPVATIIKRYMVVWFVLLLVGVYGYVLYRIQAAVTAQPSDTEISDQVQSASTPHVDPTVVDQMQSLQDRSVNVKTLFDQARSNPFKE